jgi:putative PEP-CTERM system histidine kinase
LQALISFWSHGLAAAAFAALLMWRLGGGRAQEGQRLLLAGFALTACWAWISAVAPGGPLSAYAETARNLIWLVLLHSLSATGDVRHRGVRLVYAAVALVIGLQLVADSLAFFVATRSLAEAATLLRITTAAGLLVLVHNLYGQASPASRSDIRLAMTALAAMWTYDLNLYTVTYLDPQTSAGLFEWRGVAVALTAPLFALAAKREDGWHMRLSRAATFQSLSLLALCAYFALMAILATALRGSGWDWSRGLLVALLATMTVAAMVLLPSGRARSWAKVMVAKHLFEHRYDYRSEWLRFTDTLGSSGADARPLGERVIKAFADIVEAPGGLLISPDSAETIAIAASWNWPSRHPPAAEIERCRDFWVGLEAWGRILELDAVRDGWAQSDQREIPLPDWIVGEPHAWIGVPLIHHKRLTGLVLLAAPEHRRALDWEDFDLLRTAGRQAASSLAEAHGQEALSNARRFEEFNRRFAFILHDIKNLVSQLSLLSRNAERHADNPEFRSDMAATLKSSVGKMNDLLARLSPQAASHPLQIEALVLRHTLSAIIAGKLGFHDVRLMGDASASILADVTAFEQAFGHLLQNAVEASPKGESIVVRVARRGNEICIAIADKGAGMDGDFVRNRLFQPFASSKDGGFGLGAFEARSLIVAMGGRLTVDSTPGVGTEFSIYLPAAEAAAEPTRKRA